MKTISLRSLARDAPSTTEAVLVLHQRRAIGVYRPFPRDYDAGDIAEIPISEPADPAIDLATFRPPRAMEAPMDKAAKKAIEPDKVKAPKEPRGLPTKGLGDIEGTGRDVESFREFRPAPKPGK